MVPVTGLDYHFCFAKMYGSHHFLNWWPQRATGMLHLDGFESGTITNKKEEALASSFFVGAGDRTRTGTPSLAVDFERRGFSGIWGCSEALNGTIHLAKRIKIM